MSVFFFFFFFLFLWQVKISMEYPLRPPLFGLSLYSAAENHDENNGSERYNELRAMEAEVSKQCLME
jgi:THO complex subunit 5